LTGLITISALQERFVKMPRIFTHEEYADMVYVYGYCNGNANAAVDEYQRKYPLRRTPNRAVLAYFASPETSSTKVTHRNNRTGNDSRATMAIATQTATWQPSKPCPQATVSAQP